MISGGVSNNDQTMATTAKVGENSSSLSKNSILNGTATNKTFSAVN